MRTFSGAGPTELGFLQGLGADPEPLQVGLWKPVPPSPPPGTAGPSGAQHPTHEAPERTGLASFPLGFLAYIQMRIQRRKHRA